MTPTRSRIDTYSEGELISSVIGDREAGTLTDISWKSRTASRHRCPESVFTTEDPFRDLSWRSSGTASHAGIECDLYTVPFGADIMTRWIDKVTGMRLLEQTAGIDGDIKARIERREVVVGPPPAAVFEVPADIRIRSRR